MSQNEILTLLWLVFSAGYIVGFVVLSAGSKTGPSGTGRTTPPNRGSGIKFLTT